MSLLGLEGKVVLITGGAAGIGSAAASLFAECGAIVVTCDRNESLDEGDDPLHRVLDVRDGDALRGFVELVAKRFGRIDVVVNNAGGSFVSSFLEISPKGEATLIAENFTQVTNLVRLTVPHLAPAGSIINVTSIEGHRAAPGYSIYAAMKAAQANLAKTLALELASAGIRINCVAPDAIQTEGTLALADQNSPLTAVRMPGGYGLNSGPPLGAWGTGRDGAGPIVFLASNLARFVTGVTLHVDGGNLAAGGWHRENSD